MPEETQNKSNKEENVELKAQVEALLFVSPSAASVNQIAEAIETTPREVAKIISSLEKDYLNRGIKILNNKGKYSLTSSPDHAEIVERFLHLEASTRLSTPAMETLAIVAYQQPITRPKIDAIRGVNSDSVIRTLISKGLIEEAGRSEGPGRPILYTTTPEFLQYFGLSSIEKLPSLKLPDEREIQPEPSPEQKALPFDGIGLKE